jgi:hypothetical protein
MSPKALTPNIGVKNAKTRGKRVTGNGQRRKGQNAKVSTNVDSTINACYSLRVIPRGSIYRDG